MSFKEMKQSWWLSVVLAAAFSSLGFIYTSYTHDDRDIIQRVSALEAHHKDDNQQLSHIQSQVDKLVEWALGHK